MAFISGDRHHAEISRYTHPAIGYPIYDVTSSSLNSPSRWRNELNPYRVGTIYTDTNFGTILIDWEAKTPVLRLQIRNETGVVMLQEKVPLSELRRR